jgi:hypothetical protein
VNEYQQQPEHVQQVRRVLDRMKQSIDYYRERRDDWSRYESLYMAHRNEPDYPWTSNMMLPVCFDVIETFLPHIVPDDVLIRATPGEGSDTSAQAQWDALMEYDTRQMKIAWKLITGMRQALMHGWSPYIVDYLFDVKLMHVNRFETMLPGTPLEFVRPIVAKEHVVVYDGPSLRFLDVFNCFPQPGKHVVNGQPGERSEWFIVRFEVPYKWLVMRKELLMGETDDEKEHVLRCLKETSFPELDADGDDYERHEREEMLGLNSHEMDRSVDRVEIICMFGDRGPGQLEDGLVWIGNRQVLLRDEGSPLWHGDIPIGIINDIPLLNDMCGIGEIQVAETFQLEKSDIRNARLDNMHQIVNRMWKVLNGHGVLENELLSRPGGIVHTDSMEAISPLVQQEQFFSTFREEEKIDEDVQRTLGALDVLRGMMDINRTTATGNQLLSEFAASRVRLKALGMKHQGLLQIGEWMIGIEQQFCTQDRIVRVSNGGLTEDVRVRPQDIAGHWYAMPIIDQALPMTKAQRRQDAMTRVQTLAPLMGTIVDADQLVLDFLGSQGVSNPSKFLVSTIQREAATANPQQEAVAALDEVLGSFNPSVAARRFEPGPPTIQ